MRIAVDCEFSFDVDNEFVLVCAAVTQEDGVTRTWWMDQIDDLRKYILGHSGDTWVAHNIETAEGYMFQCLGLRPTQFRWHDTLMMSRIVHNTCSLSHAKHNLAECLKRERIRVLDEDKKHSDQTLCVWRKDCTWQQHLTKLVSYKQHLLDYCLSDTTYLLELDARLDKLLSKALPSITKLDKDASVLEPQRRAAYFGFISAMCSEISWRGIPLSGERVATICRTAPSAIAKAQQDFNAKYPGTFRLDKKKLTKCVDKCREYARAVYGSNPPLTATGNVSLASEYTKQHKDMDDFLGDYYALDKRCRALASFAKPDREKNWLGGYLPRRKIVRPRINPLGAATGRCGSKPSSGFIYTMGKPFRGLCEPPMGKVLVELDYHSEEIGCQAYLTGDKRMAEMYEGPDYYTSIAQMLDPTVKDRHDPKRAKYKVISLMSNYGCGSAHLAEIAKIPKAEADKILGDLKRMFKTYWKYVDSVSHKCANEDRVLWFSDGFRIKYAGGKVTTLGNWPFQGVGAYILRLMLVELYKAKIDLVAPVHDAVVFYADEKDWRNTSDKVAQIMRDVSRRALGTAIDVGDPEVTYHGLINCHSECSDRSQYESGEAVNKHYEQFLSYIQTPECDTVGDVQNLYVDDVLVCNEKFT